MTPARLSNLFFILVKVCAAAHKAMTPPSSRASLRPSIKALFHMNLRRCAALRRSFAPRCQLSRCIHCAAVALRHSPHTPLCTPRPLGRARVHLPLRIHNR